PSSHIRSRSRIDNAGQSTNSVTHTSCDAESHGQPRTREHHGVRSDLHASSAEARIRSDIQGAPLLRGAETACPSKGGAAASLWGARSDPASVCPHLPASRFVALRCTPSAFDLLAV